MLLIRKEQMDAFRHAALIAFENDMLKHLEKFSPPLFKAVKEDQMRKVIRLGMTRAKRLYDITFRGPVRLYLELMLLFGSYFDTDPQYPWARRILADQQIADQMQRADRLFWKTKEYRDNAGGPDDVYTLDALRNIRRLAPQPVPFDTAEMRSGMLAQISQVYPQKSAYIGREALDAFIDEGIVDGQHHGFSAVRELALVIVLKFAFGHGCLDDPLYPWIANTLKKETLTDRAECARRLESKALTWLDHVLAYFDQGAVV
jgi:hypothetical protein